MNAQSSYSGCQILALSPSISFFALVSLLFESNKNLTFVQCVIRYYYYCFMVIFYLMHVYSIHPFRSSCRYIFRVALIKF